MFITDVITSIAGREHQPGTWAPGMQKANHLTNTCQERSKLTDIVSDKKKKRENQRCQLTHRGTAHKKNEALPHARGRQTSPAAKDNKITTKTVQCREVHVRASWGKRAAYQSAWYVRKKKKKSRSTSLVSTHQPTTNTEHLLLCLQDPCNNVVYWSVTYAVS